MSQDTVRTSHVLVIGIDGVRYDTLLSSHTPSLARLAEAGFLVPVRVNEAGPTISGPCWSTIATGVLAPVHDIWDNDLSPNRLADNPDFLELARRQIPGIATFLAGGWAPMVSEASGGPIFTGGGWLPEGPPAGHAHRGEDGWTVADQAITDRAVAFLGEDHPTGSAAFVYLGGVDEMGHTCGVGEVYRRYLEATDRRVGQLLDAVAARPGHEDWTVIAVTDHGHRDEGGHGGDSDEERTAWIAASGPTVPALSGNHSSTPVEQADVAGHIFHVLGLQPLTRDVVGVPFGAR